MSDFEPSDPAPTEQMAVTGDPHGEPMPSDAAAGTAAAPPDPAEKAWYQQPVTWVVGAIVLAALIGLLLFVLLRDDNGPSTVNIVTIERLDEVGDPVETEMLGAVRATVNPESFLWLAPVNGRAPEPALARADGSGVVTFRWAPTDDIEDPLAWRSTLSMTEELPAGSQLQADSFDCTLERRDEPTSLVVLAITFEAPDDPEQSTIAEYSFPNYEFVPGDVVACEVANGSPDTTTTTTTSTTTTTTTTTSTTTTTTTTVPETTLPDTTVPATTSPTETTSPSATTVPPVPTNNVMDVIDARPELTTLASLIDLAQLRDALGDADATITLFAPDDDAFADLLAAPDAPDVTDPNVVRDLLLAHTNLEAVLAAADVLALPEVDVANGGPQAVDPGPPPTIGGAGVVEADVVADNGVIHIIDAVLEIQPEQ